MDHEEDDEILVYLGFLMVLFAYSFAITPYRRWWVRPINAQPNSEGAFALIFQHMKNHDAEMFFKYTRMYPDQFDKLLRKVEPKLRKRSRRQSLCPELRLAMTLKYLAHGSSFQNLAWEFRVGHSTVSKVIPETCEAIWLVLHLEYLKLPTGDEWLDVAEEFWAKWNFPNTLGAIDGKHVELQCPLKSGTEYYNYKQYFSIILLASCDADYKFLWVDIGAQGSENDASVFRRSQIGQDLESGRIQFPPDKILPGSNIDLGHFFVADEAFPLKPYIMRPYPGKYLGEQKLIFNYRLSCARRTIENTFGILASRWRVYRAPLLCSVSTCRKIVQATVCLHNFLRTELKAHVPANLVDVELPDGNLVMGDWRQETANDTNLRPIRRTGTNVSPRNVYRIRDK